MGGIFRVTIVCAYFLMYVKVRRGLAMVSFPSAKLWFGSKKLWYAVKRIFFFTTQNGYSFDSGYSCST